MASVSESLGISNDSSASAGNVSPEPTEAPAVSAEPGATTDAGNEIANDDGVTVVEGTPLDMDSMGDHLVEIKVGGESEWKPLKEVAAGHQRLEDYTRKTQELAVQRKEQEQAQQLWDAFQTNPQFTAKALAENVGLQIAASDDAASGGEYRTPEEQKIVDLETKLDSMHQMFAQSQAQSEVDRRFTALEARVGDVDRDVIQRHMSQIGSADPEVAWAHLNLDAAQHGRAKAVNEAARQQVIDQKREAQVVHRPSGQAAKATTASTTEVPSNVRDAALYAENNVAVSEKQIFDSLPWLKKI